MTGRAIPAGGWAALLLAAALAAVALPAVGAIIDGPLGGREATPFRGKALSGAPLGLDELLGAREFLVLTFWGINCKPCLKEMELLGALWAKAPFRERANIIAVNADGLPADRLAEEMARRSIHVGYPVLPDEGRAVTGAYLNEVVPMTVLIDRSRRIVCTILGSNPNDVRRLEEIVMSRSGKGPKR